MAQVPEELWYTSEHEYLRATDDPMIVDVGITDYAQGELGDVVYVELPEKGRRIAAKEPFGTIEAVKTVSELFAPVSGEVLEINDRLASNPELVNAEPYAAGWMIRVKLDDPADASRLLSAEAYQRHVG